jgi:hypothetical protein
MEEETDGVFDDAIDSGDALSSSESKGISCIPPESSVAVTSDVEGLVPPSEDCSDLASSIYIVKAVDPVQGSDNNFSPTDAMALTERNTECDATDHVSTKAVNPDLQPSSDEFQYFTSAADGLAPSSDMLAHVDNGEASPIADLALTVGGNDCQAFFNSSEAVETGSDVGDLGTGEPLATTANNESQVDDGKEDFGDFGTAEPLATKLNLESHNDDDDFGGTATGQSGTENINPPVDEDDDDFGDFDEAPMAMSNERTDIFFESGRDPILERLYVSFPKLFASPANNEESSIDYDAGHDFPIALFIKSDFVSIESCLVC